MLAIALATLPMAHAAGAAPDPKAQLGRQLFFDTALSEPAGQSCASCDAPATAFTDPDATKPTSRGCIPSASAIAIRPRRCTWPSRLSFTSTARRSTRRGAVLGRPGSDTRRPAKGPLLNPAGMANPNKRAVVDKVRKAPYAGQFDAVFGKGAVGCPSTEPRPHRRPPLPARACSGFRHFSARYDGWLGRHRAMDRQELRGSDFTRTRRKATVAGCHPSRRGPNGEPPLFTDFTYDNLGGTRNPDVPSTGRPRGSTGRAPGYRQGVWAGSSSSAQRRQVQGTHLRIVAKTAPYMHNGYFRTLRGVGACCNVRDVRPARVRELGEAVGVVMGGGRSRRIGATSTPKKWASWASNRAGNRRHRRLHANPERRVVDGARPARPAALTAWTSAPASSPRRPKPFPADLSCFSPGSAGRVAGRSACRARPGLDRLSRRRCPSPANRYNARSMGPHDRKRLQ